MARICVKPVCDWMIASKVPLSPTRKPSRRPKFYACSPHSTVRSSQNTDDADKFYKELGMFSLRKKINDTVLRAESLTPEALELEEASRIEQEEAVRNSDLWDDLAKSSEVLMKLASRSNVVDALKDLRYKAEEAKLITQLAEMDAINYGLFKQAYSASVDVSKFLDTYETSKLLRGPFDAEGACMIIRAGKSAYYPEMWVKQLLRMYTKWSHKQGLQARAAEICFSEKGGIRSTILELESKYMYGYLSGERGVHSMISNSANSSISSEVIAASVDVIPLFLDATPDLQIDDNDLLISSPSSSDTEAGSSVCVQHIPTGLKVESSGERSRFANKIKAVNRLKAKLLVILRDQGVSSLRSIEKGSMTDIWHQQVRKYTIHPQKLVQDVRTGIQLHDLNSVLDGNIESLIAANINTRQTCSIV